MKKTIVCFILLALGLNGIGQNLKKICQQNFKDAAAQYKVMMKTLPPDKFPKTLNEFSNSGWWCSGFYPGTLLYIYEQTKDQALYNETMRILEVLKKNSTTPPRTTSAL